MLAALLIAFREMIEAGLIVGIVLAATRGVAGRVRSVTLGVAGGVAGACVVAAFADRLSALFAGSGQEVFNAAVLLVAVAMLAWHNAWMASHGRQMARGLKALGADVRSGIRPPVALTVVVGVAVLREGAEVVLFLAGVIASTGISAADTALGAGLGVLGGGLVAVLMYLGLLAVPAGRLLSVTSWMILLLAAGMASKAVVFLQQAGYAEVLSAPLWDTSWLLPDNSILGRVAQTLVGYSDQPNGLQVLVYLSAALAMWGLARAARAYVAGGPTRPSTPVAAG
jgi:high-affinity iron transporter